MVVKWPKPLFKQLLQIAVSLEVATTRIAEAEEKNYPTLVNLLKEGSCEPKGPKMVSIYSKGKDNAIANVHRRAATFN